MSIEIKLSRSNRIYRPDEPMEGKVIAKLNSGSYQSIRGTIDGAVDLQYLMTVDVIRGYLHKPLTETMEFIVESEKVGFRVTGKICTQCLLTDPVGVELTVEASALPIQSIDIHLLRVESILIGEKIATESSLIQTTQMLGSFMTWRAEKALSFAFNLLSGKFIDDLSKKRSKSDPKTPMPWTAMESVPLELLRSK